MLNSNEKYVKHAVYDKYFKQLKGEGSIVQEKAKQEERGIVLRKACPYISSSTGVIN